MSSSDSSSSDERSFDDSSHRRRHKYKRKLAKQNMDPVPFEERVGEGPGVIPLDSLDYENDREAHVRRLVRQAQREARRMAQIGQYQNASLSPQHSQHPVA